MSDLLLLGGVALGVLSLIVAVVQLLQTRPPRLAAILLVLAMAALLAGAWLTPEPVGMTSLSEAWSRLTGAQVAPLPAADPAAPGETIAD